MKILYFSSSLQEEVVYQTNIHLSNIRKLHDVEIFNIEKSLNKINSRHFQMYEDLLNYAEEINPDLVLFENNLAVPEYLLSELKVRYSFKPKIAFFMTFREVNKSKARANVIKELADMPQIHKILISSMIKRNLIWPENALVFKNKYKVVIVNEPFSEENISIDSIEVARKKLQKYNLNFDKKDFVILYSGRWSYTKGADIFVESLKFIHPNIKILIQYNGSCDIPPPENISNKNIFIVNKFIKYGTDVPTFFSSCNLVICSHRKSYEYSSSGVPQAAFSSERPIVAPDFYYFNEIVNRFKTGVLYEPENPVDMARAINFLFDNYEEINNNAKYKEALSEYISKSNLADASLEGINV